MGFSVEIKSKGAGLDKILEAIRNGAKNGVKIASEVTREEALSRKRGSQEASLILAEQKEEQNLYIGRVYTNFEYAPFLEYGTGIYAEMPHIGQTYTFYKSGMTYWFLPVAKAKKKLNNKIVYVPVRDSHGNPTGKHIECYMMFATQPFPFMRPTAFYSRNENIEAVKNSIKEALGGIK